MGGSSGRIVILALTAALTIVAPMAGGCLGRSSNRRPDWQTSGPSNVPVRAMSRPPPRDPNSRPPPQGRIERDRDDFEGNTLIRVRYEFVPRIYLAVTLIPERGQVVAVIVSEGDVRRWRGCGAWDWLLNADPHSAAVQFSAPAVYDAERVRGGHLESVAAGLTFDALRSIATAREAQIRICSTRFRLDPQRLRTLRLALEQAERVGVAEPPPNVDILADPFEGLPEGIQLL